MSTATIEFRSLYTEGEPDLDVRSPLSALPTSDGGHVHGELVITLGGKRLPHLGFFGVDDVCFDTWLRELLTVERTLAGGNARYTFDEGEQGQPAFEFFREDELLFVSVVDSTFSDGSADPSYQRVSCLWSDFVTALAQFKAALYAEIGNEAGAYAAVWWAQTTAANADDKLCSK